MSLTQITPEVINIPLLQALLRTAPVSDVINISTLLTTLYSTPVTSLINIPLLKAALRTAPVSASTNVSMVADTTYVILVNGITLTLPAVAIPGDTVSIINRTSGITSIIARNGSNIMALAQDITMDIPNGSISLMYLDTTNGWIIK